MSVIERYSFKRREVAVIEHERMRFRQMSRNQLDTRLLRITRPDKLQKFIHVAREFGMEILAEEGERKLSEITGWDRELVHPQFVRIPITPPDTRVRFNIRPPFATSTIGLEDATSTIGLEEMEEMSAKEERELFNRQVRCRRMNRTERDMLAEMKAGKKLREQAEKKTEDKFSGIRKLRFQKRREKT